MDVFALARNNPEELVGGAMNVTLDGMDKPYFDKNSVIWLKCGADKLHKVQAGRGVNAPGLPEIPEAVFEELRVNALIHREKS